MPHARFKLQLGVKKIHNRAAHFAGRDVNAMCMKKKKKKNCNEYIAASFVVVVFCSTTVIKIGLADEGTK